MKNKVIKKSDVISLLKVLSFILVFAIILEIMSAGSFSKMNALSYKNSYTRAYSFLSEPENSIDVAGIGSSDLYSAFVPMLFWEENGYTSTVISKPHQTVLASYGLLKELLECQSPKVLIIETDMLYENAPDFNPENKKINKFQKARAKAERFFDNFSEKRFENIVTSHFSVFTFHDKWKNFKFGELNEVFEDKKFVTCDHGYNFNNSVKPANANDNMKYSDITEPVSNENLLYFQKMLDLCSKKGIKVLLVEMPTQNSWNYYRHNAVQKLADENGLEFIDFNLKFDEIDFDIKSDYRDGGDHCNYYGAAKTTHYLAGVIKEHYSQGLTDKRKDASYSYWEESNAEFRKKYNV